MAWTKSRIGSFVFPSFQEGSKSDMVYFLINSNDTAETDMDVTGVDLLGAASGWTITQAVIGGAEVRASFDHLSRDSGLRAANHRMIPDSLNCSSKSVW